MSFEPNPYAPPVVEAVAETEVAVGNPLERRRAFGSTERHVKGIGVMSICFGLSSACALYLAWDAKRAGVLDLAMSGVLSVLLLVAGDQLRELKRLGRLLFVIAVAASAVISGGVALMRPEILRGTIVRLVPQLIMVAYLFTPRVREILSRPYQEGVLRKTPQVTLKVPLWTWIYGFLVMGVAMSSMSHRINTVSPPPPAAGAR
jgi:hypothetical protein